MADEKAPGKKGAADPAQEDGGARKGSLVGKIGLYAGVVGVAVILAVVTFFFVLKPLLSTDTKTDGTEASAGNPDAAIKGAQVVTVPFEQAVTTVIMNEPSTPASLLLFQVSLECANQETAALVTAHKDKLMAMLTELHSFRRRDELDDPQTKKSIEKVALQKANDIIVQYLDKPDPKIRILEVFHQSFVVEDK